MKLERKSGLKPEGCHANERVEPEQPVQAAEEPEGAVSSCGHVDPLEERFATWIGQQDRLFPSHEWLEDCSRGRCDEMSQWAQTRETDHERAGGLRQTSVAILNIDTDVDGQVEVEVVQGSPTVADPAHLHLR